MPKKKRKKKSSFAGNKNPKKLYSKLFWMIIGSVSAVVTILAITFQLGQHSGFKEAKKDEFKNFSEYLDQIKTNIDLSSVKCEQKRITTGDTIEIRLEIANRSPYECDLWIGTSAIDEQGMEVWSRRQDKAITVTAKGITTAKRYLTFPREAKLGEYDLQTNLWYGRKGDPSQSELISSAALRGQVVVVPLDEIKKELEKTAQ